MSSTVPLKFINSASSFQFSITCDLKDTETFSAESWETLIVKAKKSDLSDQAKRIYHWDKRKNHPTNQENLYLNAMITVQIGWLIMFY